jgi:hypothetical protein
MRFLYTDIMKHTGPKLALRSKIQARILRNVIMISSL